jgi:hypothetical protein
VRTRRSRARYGAEQELTAPHEAVAVIEQLITEAKVKSPEHSISPEPTPSQSYEQFAPLDDQLMVVPA